jgi:putative PIN family toxin of toxin-antitoxin system
MIRVVLDTNVVVSALLNPQGLPARAFLATISGRAASLCLSADIYSEYEEVIRRPKFNRSPDLIEQTLHAIRKNARWVKPSETVRTCSDPDDDIFLECCQAARAHYLVTGNVQDFPSEWAGTRIVTARRFLDAMSEILEE